jgi:hypothetical protein
MSADCPSGRRESVSYLLPTHCLVLRSVRNIRNFDRTRKAASSQKLHAIFAGEVFGTQPRFSPRSRRCRRSEKECFLFTRAKAGPDTTGHSVFTRTGLVFQLARIRITLEAPLWRPLRLEFMQTFSVDLVARELRLTLATREEAARAASEARSRRALKSEALGSRRSVCWQKMWWNSTEAPRRAPNPEQTARLEALAMRRRRQELSAKRKAKLAHQCADGGLFVAAITFYCHWLRAGKPCHAACFKNRYKTKPRAVKRALKLARRILGVHYSEARNTYTLSPFYGLRLRKIGVELPTLLSCFPSAPAGCIMRLES